MIMKKVYFSAIQPMPCMHFPRQILQGLQNKARDVKMKKRNTFAKSILVALYCSQNLNTYLASWKLVTIESACFRDA